VRLESELENISLAKLKGIGPKTEKRLQLLGIDSVADLLFHLPSRYQDRTSLSLIVDLKAGVQAVIEGVIVATTVEFGRRRSLVCHIKDASGELYCRFFNFSKGQQQALAPGKRLRCFGEVRYIKKRLEFIHPDYEVITDDRSYCPSAYLTAVYPTTEGLSQKALRKIIAQALSYLSDPNNIRDLIPSDIFPGELLANLHYPSLQDSLTSLHCLPVDAEQQIYRKRLAFEELVAYQLKLRRQRLQLQQQQAPVLALTPQALDNFKKELSFELTTAQKCVYQQISLDLQQPYPMLRMVQGDVGSGKTVVAAMAAMQAILQGYQVALMAPTEVLAKQHMKTFSAWFSSADISCCLLTGKLALKEKKQCQENITSHRTSMIIGTHALLQEGIGFAKLGLVIIDEQHRFGVQQRLLLANKGINITTVPHQLMMSATPIPRSLAMTAYADLDYSIIDELPPGRIPVKTAVMPDSRRAEVIARIQQVCETEKRQVYWVCTLVEESEILAARAADSTANKLQQQLPTLGIALIHGRLSSEAKEVVLADFRAGVYDILVATTVIEVGVDIPNASLMIIENPERLGLAQLHQLRGRVGRDKKASHCILLFQSPLSREAKERLALLRESNDGFYLAEQDLRLRGPGEILGTRQAGMLDFRIASMHQDQALVAHAQTCADQLLAKYPDHVDPLIRRWLKSSGC